MKVFNLCCAHDHRFEGWFSSEQDYLAQTAGSRIECPICGTKEVQKLPSAPRLNLSRAQTPQRAQAATAQQEWLTVARQVMANTEDVGDGFADEARRIHYKETPARNIRGVASSEQHAALIDEGIEVMSIPLPGILKQPLH
ncbi:DUF1178 family protein [Herminiimonas sp. CN]|uniref:DUF1178 family protein n=1 Tax=Herminiimonas sp. CN TaxID=1349818 RepID=UPI000473D1B9|nr:DUF1178 family protein [Herminiimonas sp. CN]